MRLEKESLPKGWIKTKLENVINLSNEKFNPASNENKTFIGLEHIEKNTMRIIEKGESKNLTSTKTKFRSGDILYGKLRPYLNKICIPDFNGVCSTDILVFSKNPYRSSKYIALLLSQSKFVRFANRNSTGVQHPRIKFDIMSQFQIPLPPLNEQKRIVQKIESILSQIDAGKKRLDEVRKLLKQNKQSVLKSAFEGNLVPQDPNDESSEILLKRIHGDSKELIFEKDNIPKEWVKIKIKNICELIGGGTPSRQKIEYFEGNITWLTPTEISKEKIVRINSSREKITKLGLKKSSAKIIPTNSVLLTSRASIGYVAIAGIGVTTNQGFTSFVCNQTTYNYFLAYWLFGNKDELESQATGTTFKEISKSKIRELIIPLPPLNEQKRIVSKIESILGRIDANFVKTKMLTLIHDTI